MQKIKIITDTASDIDLSTAEKYNIELLPFKVVVNGTEYKEGYDFSKDEFYDILDKCDKIPSHSQITPYEYLESFQKISKEGYNHIIVVPINQTGSSTFQSALNARMQFYNENKDSEVKIYIINTLTYTNGYGYPVRIAAKIAQETGDVSRILEYFEHWFSRLEIFFTTFDLKYAKHSGRICAAAAVAGELLGIKPIINMSEGKSEVYQKVRSMTKSMDVMCKIAKERMEKDGEYMLIYGNNPEEFNEFKKVCKKAFGKDAVDCARIGACISINSGPQVLAIVFLGKKRNEQIVF